MMSEELRKKALASYQFYEKQAQHYYNELLNQLVRKSYVSTLKRDFKIWKRNHRKPFLLPHKQRKLDSYLNHESIPSLRSRGKLDQYLKRSVSYIYLRDLGKALNEDKTQRNIQRTVNSLKNWLIEITSKTDQNEPNLFTPAKIYRWGEKVGVELTVVWLMNKLSNLEKNFPKGFDSGEARRKLVKLIAGVVMHQLDELRDENTSHKRKEKLEQAIRLGYSYGLTYPLIDDLLDSTIITEEEKKTFTRFVRETLLTGEIPELQKWTGPNQAFFRFVHRELGNAFLYIKNQQTEKTRHNFFEVAYVFFESQEKDRNKDLLDATYSNEDLLIPVILKSAFSRLIARSILPTARDETFNKHTFYYGIYNQLADDFTDMFRDLEAKQVTPYTYYLTYHESRPDLINPFELYWTVIYYLIHHVYQSDSTTREVILSRAINSQKRFKLRVGPQVYKDTMKQLSFGNQAFDRQLKRLVEEADNVDFFDKLLRDHMITNENRMEKERKSFLDTAEIVRDEINQMLSITKEGFSSPIEEPIIEAANYSLENGGKRLRPIMAWFLGVQEYSLDPIAIRPLLKSIEYMHTASLIFDDLPSQDNAPFRRGKPTLHRVYDAATAELTGLFLTQKAVTEQASLRAFRPEAVQRLIRYSSETITAATRGQAMDLRSKGKELTIEELEAICFYKTGIAFEASLIMPAILAEKSDKEMEFLKIYAYHAGIAFQIKDDLLDVEADSEVLGKPAGIDSENQTANFVSILGADQAKKVMWQHYTLAAEELEKEKHASNFLNFFLDYIVQREK